MIKEVKFCSGGYKYPVTLTYKNKRIYIKFRYVKSLIPKIKALEGARWNPDAKCWHCTDTARNKFQLQALQGSNPYQPYDAEIIHHTVTSGRPLRNHQKDMVSLAITRRHCVFGGEMGTGKTLAAIESVEWYHNNVCELGDDDVWYFGPVSGVRAVRRELVKWDHKIKWSLNTYAKLNSIVTNWPAGKPAPKVVIFDESSKIKNPTAQCSQAALHISNSMREEYGRECLIIPMSGTPAPRVPTDWWHQCEVACPGFLVESSVPKMKKRLGIVEQRESLSGGVYPHLVCWKDDPLKCDACGEYEQNHGGKDHAFKASIDEISYLSKRLDGLVIVVLKKDCTDLPEKQYKTIAVKPTPQMMRTAKALRANSPSAVVAFSKLRELSDGFQYKTREAGEVNCDRCDGSGECMIPIVPDSDIDSQLGMTEAGISESLQQDGSVEMKQITCPNCEGTGLMPGSERYVESLSTPKDDVLKELLDEYNEGGRVTIWAGFQGSIDRIIEICRTAGWAVLKVDGRGYKGIDPKGNVIDSEELLAAMDLSDKNKDSYMTRYPKVAFVGNPGAGGMGLTLTSSPVEIFYSNSFDGAARPQAEDRGHRLGMDTNRGLLIIDLVCLPSDLVVIENLKLKKKLQAMTMGELEDAWGSAETELEKW